MILARVGRAWYTEFTKDMQTEALMRCSCKRCGTYMIQQEQGTESRCICPQCFFTCTACVAPSGGQPLSPIGLRQAYLARQQTPAVEEADPFHGPAGPEEFID